MSAPLRLSWYLARQSTFARTSRQLQSIASRRWPSTSRPRARHALVLAEGPINARFREIQRNRQFLFTTTASCSPTTAFSPSVSTSSTKSTLNSTIRNEPLPAYEPPQTGILSHFPPSCVPYAELIRLDKPAGTYYLFLPCLFSTLLAAPLTDPMVPPSTVLYTSVLFFTGAWIMRGAGCTVNDLWDRNLDPHVARTRLRPIARGAITVQQAIPYLGVQLLTGLALLLQFPYQCLVYGIPSLVLVAIYPLAKRVTHYPQAVLGLTFSWGAIMGFPALGVDLLANMSALLSAACLYGSCVAWTIVYDMIYAYQDIRDDAKAGIKSIALAQEKNAKTFLSVASGIQVGLLAGAGMAIGAGPVYFIGTCGGAAATLGYMIWKVNLKSVTDCWKWFRQGAWFTGGAVSIGLLGEYFTQYLNRCEEETATGNARAAQQTVTDPK